MSGLSPLQRLFPWIWEIGKPPQPSPEEWLEEMTARLELELIELRRVLAESIALLKSAERRQSRRDPQFDLDLKGSLDRPLREQEELIERIRQSLSRLERQYAQARGRKNWYLSRLKLALVQEKLAGVKSRWHRVSASEVFTELEALEVRAPRDGANSP
ncbi:MAG: hypothetical protein GC158_08375 [Cyanobacteria bacterium RI_101]|jgi:phage shock protein A|nr:hypothetical protein [Cyanobacteria bacterium RI_101]